ncbi:hypothetical protein ACE1AT_13870 [Pelatocladus sp. BLCC-F211]|uniref:hypothetical protein n=1 Tax=Pelatocladus sp. BLCC-F211 TaxID=3342752 RepID=UPI0035B900A1
MTGKGGRRKTTWGNSWNHGETKVIRVPAALESQIMEYARAIDSGLVPSCDQEQLQKAILLVIDKFVQERSQQFHPNQYSRTASTHTRRWDELRKFRNAIAQQAPNIRQVAPNITR